MVLVKKNFYVLMCTEIKGKKSRCSFNFLLIIVGKQETAVR